jgi:phosphonate transport system substrate-binding protein
MKIRMPMKTIGSVLLLLLAAAIALAGCAARVDRAPLPARLAIGVQSTKPEETRAAWQPLVADLSRKLAIPMELVTADQAETVQALAAGQVDVVWLSSSAAIDAVVDANARTFALYENVNGTQGYKAVVVTRADSGIKTLEEALAPGRYRYAAGVKTSTSGYVLPQHFLFGPRGTTAEERFKSVVYGGHAGNLEALWSGKVDVSINNTTDLAAFKARTPGADEGLVTLWESPMVPNDVLMARADIPAATLAKVAALFLGYGKTEPEQALFRKASGISHFVAADNLLLEPVSAFKFATERTQARLDHALSAEQIAQRLQAVDERERRFMRSLAPSR